MDKLRIGNIYNVNKQLGGKGTVYAGDNSKTQEEVAIKIEKLYHEVTPMLQYEARVYHHITPAEGIPKLFWFGVDGEYSCMVTSILGPNL